MPIIFSMYSVLVRCIFYVKQFVIVLSFCMVVIILCMAEASHFKTMGMSAQYYNR